MMLSRLTARFTVCRRPCRDLSPNIDQVSPRKGHPEDKNTASMPSTYTYKLEISNPWIQHAYTPRSYGITQKIAGGLEPGTTHNELYALRLGHCFT